MSLIDVLDFLDVIHIDDKNSIVIKYVVDTMVWQCLLLFSPIHRVYWQEFVHMMHMIRVLDRQSRGICLVFGTI